MTVINSSYEVRCLPMMLINSSFEVRLAPMTFDINSPSGVGLAPMTRNMASFVSPKIIKNKKFETQKNIKINLQIYKNYKMETEPAHTKIHTTCFVIRSQLNGNNGSWTNTDDLAMRHVGGGQRARIPRRAAQNRAARRGGNNFGPPAPQQQVQPQILPPPGPVVPPPPPPPPPLHAAFPLVGTATEEQIEGVANYIHCSGFPNCRSTFEFDEQVSPRTHLLFEPNGTPFCGLVSIDLAIRREPDIPTYFSYMLGPNPATAGTTPQLNLFANNRRVNLVVVAGREVWTRVWSLYNDPGWPTVVLHHENNHYKLVTMNKASLVNTRLPVFNDPTWNPIFVVFSMSLLICSALAHEKIAEYVFAIALVLSFLSVRPVLVFTRPCYSNTDVDRRPIIDRRDPSETQDIHCHAEETWFLYFAFFRLIPVFWFSYRTSLLRFEQAYKEAQGLVNMGFDPKKALSTVTAIRTVNTDSSIPGIYMGTARAVLLAIKYTNRELPEPLEPATTAFNATGWEMAVTDADYQAIRANQGQLVGMGYRYPEVEDRGTRAYNQVLSVSKWIRVKKNIPIAVAAVPVFSKSGQVGPGFYPVTDTLTILGAFTVRSMTAKPKIDSRVEEFLKFAIPHMRKYVRDSTIPVEEECDVRDYYRRVAQGKKSVDQIEKDIEEYDEWLSNKANSKFGRNSNFVKFEDSSKVVEGSRCVKPRLIMTMSKAMMIECAGVMDLIHMWNEGPFRNFQVKNMSQEDIIDKITDLTWSKHEVTDYSSFESSVDYMIRKIENSVMLEMCKRSGRYETARHLRNYCFGGRVMHAQGIRVKIFSRCSGDYWTSFGNGIVNYCIAAYSAHRKNRDMSLVKFVAEGDDGLIEQNVADVPVVAELGFKYSTSVSGVRPGDADFLRNRWVDGKRYLNIGRCMKSFWIKKAATLKREKQMFLARCVAYSLHHLSPHHPVTEAIVQRLLNETGGAKRFKGYKKYLDTWGLVEKDYRPVRSYVYHVDETMRAEIARGSGEFPPLPVASQLELERSILNDATIYVGTMLDGFDDFRSMEDSRIFLTERVIAPNAGTSRLLELFGVKSRV